MPRLRAALLLIGLLTTVVAGAAERFPRPELPSWYQYPVTVQPPARAVFFDVLDVAVLTASLALAAYLVHRRRARLPLLLLTVFALLYFGFYRKGCICPIGAIQHVAAAVSGPVFLPLVVLLFFALPLIAVLFFGRIFCSSVCPLGAVQDIVVLRPLRVPLWLEYALGMLPFVYLGLAVLFAVTGAGYLMCMYDPFVSFFRLTGSREMVFLGVAFLAMGLFVGRPYCRFLCPYGALLRLGSHLSWKRVTTTPDMCIRCRLCEEACPFGAIRVPTEEAKGERRTSGRTWLVAALAALPVLVGLGTWVGYLGSNFLASGHPTVLRAEDVRRDEAKSEALPTFRTEAFQKTGRLPEQLYAEEAAVLGEFRVGSALFGGWVGLVFGLKLIALSIRRTRTDYEPDRGTCLACGRCYAYCPREHLRLKTLRGEVPADEDARPVERSVQP